MITEKRIVSALLSFTLMVIVSMLMTENVWAAGISYVERGWNGDKVTAETKSCTSYSKVADVSGSKELSASWYVADTNQTFGSSDRCISSTPVQNLPV